MKRALTRWIILGVPILLSSFSRAAVDYNYGADEGPDAAAAAPRLRSPQGRWDIAFQKDNPLGGETLKHIRYIVSFNFPTTQTSAAQTVFIDVIGSDPGAQPTALKDWVAGIIWSPKEDIAILPMERWPSSHSQKTRQAVSLITRSSWQTGDFPLEDSSLIWIDPLIVVGNWTGHCRAAVGKFDGTSGKMSTIVEAASPEGYHIVSSENKKLLMKKVLDECADAKATDNFKPDCIMLDLRFLRREVATCP